MPHNHSKDQAQLRLFIPKLKRHQVYLTTTTAENWRSCSPWGRSNRGDTGAEGRLYVLQRLELIERNTLSVHFESGQHVPGRRGQGRRTAAAVLDSHGIVPGILDLPGKGLNLDRLVPSVGTKRNRICMAINPFAVTSFTFHRRICCRPMTAANDKPVLLAWSSSRNQNSACVKGPWPMLCLPDY